MTTNSIVQYSGVLSRIGSPEERQYLVEVMLEQLGIPGAEAHRADVIAVAATAAQRNIEYGWMPGVHMHVQSYNPKDGPTKYVLVDGEKAWKDSAARWRTIHGINWRFQRRPMTREELKEEIRLTGFEVQKAAPHSFGIWSRVLIIGEDDPDDLDNPVSAAGLYFGAIKVGRYWKDDLLPTGTSSRFVATRRADKHALMQSTLTLIPLDDKTPQERAEILANNLAVEYEVRNPLPANSPNLRREVDGNVLFPDSPPVEVVAEDYHEIPPEPDEESEDISFYEPAEEEENEEIEPETTAVADIYAHITDGDMEIPEDTFKWIMSWRNKAMNSAIMIPKAYGALVGLVDKVVGDGEPVHGKVLSCLCGMEINRGARPGEDLSELTKALKKEDENEDIKQLRIVLGMCELAEEEQV